MNDDFVNAMMSLPEPEAPASLRATVMARIARETDRRPEPVPAGHAVARGRERLAVGWVVAGLVAVLGATAYNWYSAGSLLNLAAPRIGQPLGLVPVDPSQALVIGLGLLLYLAGLLAPLTPSPPSPTSPGDRPSD